MLLLFLGGGCLFAQNIDSQQSFDSTAIRYFRRAGNQSPLYSGKAQEYYPQTLHHPYFVDWKFAKAHLSYCGVTYSEVLLRLDMNRDELIIISPDFSQIVLFPENVDFAELHGQHIIFFRRDSLPGCPSSGYYFLLHSAECKVMEKQSYMMNYNDKAEPLLYTYFYLYKDGVYHTIRTKRGLLKILHPYKKELKKYISTHRLSFQKAEKRYLIRDVVSYYEILSER